MPARVSETFVLRTYPFREADLIVSFFTRDQGKLRGVARRARKPKSPFGSGLERLSHVRHVIFYEGKSRAGQSVRLRADRIAPSPCNRITPAASHSIISPRSPSICCPRMSPTKSFSACWHRRAGRICAPAAKRGPRSYTSASGPCVSPACFRRCACSREVGRDRARRCSRSPSKPDAALLDQEPRPPICAAAGSRHGATRRAQIPDRPAAGGSL